MFTRVDDDCFNYIMDDLLNKTNELASLVNSLQQSGGDNSDLCGIIAQLEAAVAKRTVPATPPVESSTAHVQVEAQLLTKNTDSGTSCSIHFRRNRTDKCRIMLL